MFHRSHWGYLCVLAAIALLPFTGAVPARAAASIGVIDRDVLQKDYLGYKNANIRMQQFVDTRQKSYETLRMGFGLGLEDFKEYDRLTKFEVVIEAERVKQYQDVATANGTLFELLKTKDADKLTEEEKAQFAKFESALKETAAIIDERRTKFMQEIRDEDSRIAQVLSGLEDKAIEKTAQQKKLEIVLNRNLQTDKDVQRFVLWGGVDISTDVVKLLNAEFKEALLDAPPAQPAMAPATAPVPATAK